MWIFTPNPPCLHRVFLSTETILLLLYVPTYVCNLRYSPRAWDRLKTIQKTGKAIALQTRCISQFRSEIGMYREIHRLPPQPVVWDGRRWLRHSVPIGGHTCSRQMYLTWFIWRATARHYKYSPPTSDRHISSPRWTPSAVKQPLLRHDHQVSSVFHLFRMFGVTAFSSHP